MTSKILYETWIRGVTVTLEFEPQDCWIGAFWKKSYNPADILPWKRQYWIYDVWACLFPMLPIHLRWLKDCHPIDREDQ